QHSGGRESAAGADIARRRQHRRRDRARALQGGRRGDRLRHAAAPHHGAIMKMPVAFELKALAPTQTLGHSRTTDTKASDSADMAPQDLSEPPRTSVDRLQRGGSIGMVLLVAVVLVGAAVAFLFIGRARAEPYIVGLLTVLAVVGVFSMFAIAAG